MNLNRQLVKGKLNLEVKNAIASQLSNTKKTIENNKSKATTFISSAEKKFVINERKMVESTFVLIV